MKGIYKLLLERYKLRPSNAVFIIYDEGKRKIAEKFIKVCREIGSRVDCVCLDSKRFESVPIMKKIYTSIRKGDYELFLNIFEARLEETHSRIALVLLEKEAGGMIGHAPGITKSMIDVVINYKELAERAKKLKKLLKDADKVAIKTKLGSDFSFSVKKRKFFDDVSMNSKMSNIPCGEVWCAPRECTAEGTLISDGSAGGFGLLPQPLVIDIKQGKAVNIDWLFHKNKDRKILEKIRKTLNEDEGAGYVCEFGIGLAPFRLCGNILQDEKAEATIHIAFGANDFFGGKIKSKSHVDFLICNPAVSVHAADGNRSVTVMTEGVLMI